MELLSEIKINRPSGNAVIQLIHGDLSAVSYEHATDIMVVSAYPNNYDPLPGTLIGALFSKGLNFATLAEHKQVDLTTQLGCWLSQELAPAMQQQFNTKRFLCFEPRILSNKPEEVVSNVFRCLNNFLIPDIETTETKMQRPALDINTVAMPMLATGNQKASIDLILPAIVTAAIFWLQQGLPIDCLKLFVYNQNDIAVSLQIFKNFAFQMQQQEDTVKETGIEKKDAVHTWQRRTWKQKIADKIGLLIEEKVMDYLLQDLYEAAENEDERNIIKKLIQKSETKETAGNQTDISNTDTKVPASFDYFISYAHVCGKEVLEFVTELKNASQNLNIFYDRDSIAPGGLWIKNISDAIQNSKQVICILSPQYSASNVCWDEFQCAKLKEYNTKQPVIKTIYLYKDAALPPVMGIYSYIDCCEGNIDELKNAVTQILK